MLHIENVLCTCKQIIGLHLKSIFFSLKKIEYSIFLVVIYVLKSKGLSAFFLFLWYNNITKYVFSVRIGRMKEVDYESCTIRI